MATNQKESEFSHGFLFVERKKKRKEKLWANVKTMHLKGSEFAETKQSPGFTGKSSSDNTCICFNAA